MKKLIAVLIILVLAFAFASCSKEETPEVPDIPSFESQPEEIPEEPEEENEDEIDYENLFIPDEYGYETTENGVSNLHFPNYMQPFTVIIYDENCNPEIIEGGRYTAENVKAEPYVAELLIGPHEECIIEPCTKVTYDLHGFIQNVYYEVPKGSGNYQLSNPEWNGEDR